MICESHKVTEMYVLTFHIVDHSRQSVIISFALDTHFLLTHDSQIRTDTLVSNHAIRFRFDIIFPTVPRGCGPSTPRRHPRGGLQN